jgi:lysozyme
MEMLKRIFDSITAPMPSVAQPEIQITSTGCRRVCDAAITMIRSFEGMANVKSDGLVYPYHDAIGLPTIGIGHLLSRKPWDDLSQWQPITQQDAIELKYRDLDKFSNGVSLLLKVPVTDNQFGALVSLAFNIGLGNLQGSTLLRKLNRGDSVNEIAEEFIKWNKAGGKILNGLTRRRKAEAKLFLS